MLAVPPVVLDMLNLKAGSLVELTVDGGKLMVSPQSGPRYTLEELLAASDYSQPRLPDEREWLDSPPVGRELL